MGDEEDDSSDNPLGFLRPKGMFKIGEVVKLYNDVDDNGEYLTELDSKFSLSEIERTNYVIGVVLDLVQAVLNSVYCIHENNIFQGYAISRNLNNYKIKIILLINSFLN